MTANHPQLRAAVVLEPGQHELVVAADGGRRTVGCSVPFGSRAAELRPGHLVALAAGEPELIVWRWFDAVVLEVRDDEVRLWEPAHGEVTARSRRPGHLHRLGGRAYLSGRLPGVQWWVAGPADGAPGHADVELDEVAAFSTDHGLWHRLTS